ncbi:F-box domain containing protein [Tanacetum coccineum]
MSISWYTPFDDPITTEAATSVSGGRISNIIAAGDIVELAKMMKEARAKPMSNSHDIGTYHLQTCLKFPRQISARIKLYIENIPRECIKFPTIAKFPRQISARRKLYSENIPRECIKFPTIANGFMSSQATQTVVLISTAPSLSPAAVSCHLNGGVNFHGAFAFSGSGFMSSQATQTVVLISTGGLQSIDDKVNFNIGVDVNNVKLVGMVLNKAEKMLTLNLMFRFLSLESFTGSKTLKVLRLESVELLDHDLVQSFLVNCPLLKELSLINCITSDLDYFSISCPNLKTLKIDDRGLRYDSHMRYNVYAVIELKDVKPNAERDDNFGVTICELFAQVSHVEYLSINCFLHRSISKRCECCKLPKEGFPESLPNMKKLELKFDCDLMVVLLRILKCSFNLESLHLITPKNISSYEVKRFFEELEVVETRRTLTRHLKRVEFSDFKGEKEILDIARFLLEHGNALEEMVFSWSKRRKYRKQSMEAMNEVSNFYKASSSVKVITVNG